MTVEPVPTAFEIEQQRRVTPISPSTFTALAVFYKTHAEIIKVDDLVPSYSSINEALLGLTEDGEPCAVVSTWGLLDQSFRLYKGLIAVVGVFHNIYNSMEWRAYVFDKERKYWEPAEDKNVLVPLLGMTQALYKGLTVDRPKLFLDYVRQRNLGKDRNALLKKVERRMREEHVTSQDLIGMLLYLAARDT